MHVMMHRGGLVPGYVDPLTMMAAYVAAIVHDFEHLGLTNDYLIHSADMLAIRWAGGAGGAVARAAWAAALAAGCCLERGVCRPPGVVQADGLCRWRCQIAQPAALRCPHACICATPLRYARPALAPRCL
jgi:hypothetical protein